ncbi:MAG: Fe-S protein assembly co-chaperone HscB [Acidobacteria bacterium]|nr:Fe-S protein assembly co-chaperone HscB [Acidobacteriota bacterium]
MTSDTQAINIHACRHCGTGAPVDAHFCPQCEKILTLARHGDYFRFLGLPRKLQIDLADLEQRFRTLSRQFHPDYFYNATPAERLASMERSSYLNDAYRTLRQPLDRVEYLLRIEKMAPRDRRASPGQVPEALLEEFFSLSEQLDEIRAARESGASGGELRAGLARVRAPLAARRAGQEHRFEELSRQWDDQVDAGVAVAERRPTLEGLRELLLERTYVDNLMATLEREEAAVAPAQDDTPV